MDNDIYSGWSSVSVYYWFGGIPPDSCYMGYDQQQCSNNEHNLECHIWWEQFVGGSGNDYHYCCCNVFFDEVNEAWVLNKRVVDSGIVMHKEKGVWVHNTIWLCENSVTAHEHSK
jgi:hypothetical protein